MPATIAVPAENSILRNVSWERYEQILEEAGSPGTRVTFDNGLLQIMVVSAAHENPNRTLATIVEVAAEETGTDACHMGSVTLQRPDLLKGFEPDSCFYFRNADAVRQKDEIDLAIDPPPDLVIEVDVTRSSIDRLPIFAAVGVPEVWRYRRGRVSMYELRSGGYERIEKSAALPVLSAAAVTRFTESYRRTKWLPWVAGLRTWIRRDAGNK